MLSASLAQSLRGLLAIVSRSREICRHHFPQSLLAGKFNFLICLLHEAPRRAAAAAETVVEDAPRLFVLSGLGRGAP